jgi:hypothetical protein
MPDVRDMAQEGVCLVYCTYAPMHLCRVRLLRHTDMRVYRLQIDTCRCASMTRVAVPV